MTREAGVDVGAYLAAYELPASWRAVQEESGMNNTTRMIYAGDVRYVLRIYDNHQDSGIVELEHHLLKELQLAKLPFHVPQPVFSREGKTITVHQSGKLGALYHYIEGERSSPDNDSHIEGLGWATGMLAHALQRINVINKPLYEPYYEWEKTHFSVPNDRLRQLVNESELLNYHLDELEQLIGHRERLSELRTHFMKLPHQWIHGDLVFSNCLAAGDRIVGILDFEFCTKDIRVMELAVVLAEFPHDDTDEAVRRIGLLCQGYGSAAQLTREELHHLPDLIKLRMMDVFLHFAGRYESNLDAAEVWDKQIVRTSFVCGWVDRNRERLMELFLKFLL
ncbi:phosphotransferase [Paenibacillus oenotherae]|uniref:Phosphotransferase n=1 Tax=Paenibacillus oenotherae TaxID=1435645 RepID=A0ABS7DC61_9BACL|nr:phosphotransferase [Paenibacillus oenotherae]MBW7477529.1 phosphotransferase [Paenibacillus oenotherae]